MEIIQFYIHKVAIRDNIFVWRHFLHPVFYLIHCKSDWKCFKIVDSWTAQQTTMKKKSSNLWRIIPIALRANSLLTFTLRPVKVIKIYSKFNFCFFCLNQKKILIYAKKLVNCDNNYCKEYFFSSPIISIILWVKIVAKWNTFLTQATNCCLIPIVIYLLWRLLFFSYFIESENVAPSKLEMLDVCSKIDCWQFHLNCYWLRLLTHLVFLLAAFVSALLWNCFNGFGTIDESREIVNIDTLKLKYYIGFVR
jgi:hypothetical protein